MVVLSRPLFFFLSSSPSLLYLLNGFFRLDVGRSVSLGSYFGLPFAGGRSFPKSSRGDVARDEEEKVIQLAKTTETPAINLRDFQKVKPRELKHIQLVGV